MGLAAAAMGALATLTDVDAVAQGLLAKNVALNLPLLAHAPLVQPLDWNGTAMEHDRQAPTADHYDILLASDLVPSPFTPSATMPVSLPSCSEPILSDDVP